MNRLSLLIFSMVFLAGCGAPESRALLDGASGNDASSAETAVGNSGDGGGMSLPETGGDASAADVGFPGPSPDGGVDTGGVALDAGVFPLPLPSVTGCTSMELMPVRARGGVNECIPVGARIVAPTADGWPSFVSRGETVVYVDAAAAAGGNGTMTSPYATIDAAFGGSPTATVLLLRSGMYSIASRIVQRNVRLIGVDGAGATPTVLQASGGPAIEARGPSANVTLENLSVVAVRTPQGVLASSGATLSLVNVSFNQGGVEITNGARLRADAVSIRDCVQPPIALRNGSAGTIKGVRINGLNSAPGIYASNSTVSISETYVTGALPGIALVGASPSGIADQLDRVSIRDCVHTGLWVAGTGRRVVGNYLDVSRIEAGTSGNSGDGVGVSDGADFRLDVGFPALNAGSGSVLQANRRSGLFATGAGTRVSVEGASIENNLGPGIYGQTNASFATVGALKVRRNGSAGAVFVNRAEIVEIRDCVFEGHTASPTFTGINGALRSLGGVGVALAAAINGSGGTVSIRDCVFENNLAMDILALATRAELRGASANMWNVVRDQASNLTGNYRDNSATPPPGADTLQTLNVTTASPMLP